MPVITKGMDFMGKTNSAVAKLLSAMGELGSLPEASSVGCSSGGPVLSVVQFGSTPPKQPSSNLVKEEVSVLVRATLILFRPSHFNCAALLSRCAASSKSITPYVKENDMGFKDNDQEAVLLWSEQ